MPTDDEHAATLTALRELAVQLGVVGADVRAIRDRLDQHDRTQGDHETRIRQIEQMGCPVGIRRAGSGQDIEDRVRSLERWRWSIPSLAAVLGVVSLAVSAWAALRH